MASTQPLRMSGMNSGLDTESIISALTANSKLKITKQERQLLKYKATQDAYRDVISKFQNIQKKYFDILNKNSNLKGSTMWSQFSAKTMVNGEEKKMAGVSIKTSINSVASSYNVKVKNTATQSKLKGNSLSDGAVVDTSRFADGESYGMTVTVGDETKNITFNGGATGEETLSNINDALSEAFGESNTSSTSGKGMVYVDDSGKMISRAGKGITMSGAAAFQSNAVLDLAGIKSGKNSISVRVGEETVDISFQTIENGYFDEIFDESGNLKEETSLDTEQKNKLKLYNEVKDDYVEMKRYEEFEAWKESATPEQLTALKDEAFEKAAEKQKTERLDKFLNKEYTAYVKEAAKDGSDALQFEEWKAANYSDDPDNQLNKDFEEYYKDYALDKDMWSQATYNQYESFKELRGTVTEENVTATAEDIVNHYNQSSLNNSVGKAATESGVEIDVEVKDGKATITAVKTAKAQEIENIDLNNAATGSNTVTLNANGESVDITFDTLAKGHFDDLFDGDGNLKDEATLTTEQKEKLAVYKEAEASLIDEKGEGFKDSMTADDVVAHYNKTSLKEAVEEANDNNNLDYKIAIKNGNASITADIKTEVTVAVTAGSGSTNDFGVQQAQSSVTQISNSTKLSDLGLTADANGKYNFSINGESFSFDGETTVKEMMRNVNASDAGVKMTYSSLDNAFTITSSDYGVNSSVEISDGGEGLLSAIGLTGGDYTQGTNLEVTINGMDLESNGNSIEADGTTFTFNGVEAGTEFDVEVEKNNTAVKDTIKAFVEDYNKLIEDVYKYYDEKPDEKYYFLADQDKEDLALSETQEEKWEEKSKQGLLYHDSLINTVMTNLRMSLMGSVEAADGKLISLSSLGITTATDYKEHGKLELDEEALDAAIAEYGDDISKLFSDEEDGIMVKFDKALEAAVGTTGDKGTLINKAGLASGSSATDNDIYNQMKRVTDKIKSLETRYESEQNRLWKKYSAMESMLASLNSQQSSFLSYFGGGM